MFFPFCFLPRKNQNKCSNEQGRSLFEIICVLAVSGVLVIVGTWTYRYAMNVRNRNETVDTINKTIAGAVTGLMWQQLDASADGELVRVQASQIISDVPVNDDDAVMTPLDTTVSVWRPTGATQIETENSLNHRSESMYLEVQLDNLPYDVCRQILSGTSGYKSAFKTERRHMGITTGADSSEIDDFCAGIDSTKWTTTSFFTADPGEGSLTLCYSDADINCALAIRIDNPCITYEGTEIAHHARYRDCGVCSNGNLISLDAETARAERPYCQKCGETGNSRTTFKNLPDSLKEGQAVGLCGKCENGFVVVDPSKYNPQCRECLLDQTATELNVSQGARVRNKENGTIRCTNATDGHECGICTDGLCETRWGQVTHRDFDREELRCKDVLEDCCTLDLARNCRVEPTMCTGDLIPNEAADACVCPNGKHLKNGTKDVCVECNINSECPENTFCVTSGIAALGNGAACRSNTYAKGNTCQPCSQDGSMIRAVDEQSCHCPNGETKFCGSTTANICCVEGGTATCKSGCSDNTDCDADYYCAGVGFAGGQGICTKCPEGMHRSKTAATQCEVCAGCKTWDPIKQACVSSCKRGYLCTQITGGSVPDCGGQQCLKLPGDGQPNLSNLVRLPGAINGRIYYVPENNKQYIMTHSSASAFCEYYGLHLATVVEACNKDYYYDSGWDCANISQVGGSTYEICDKRGNNCRTHAISDWNTGNGSGSFWLANIRGNNALRVTYSCGNNHEADRCGAYYPLCYSEETISCPAGYYCPEGNVRQKKKCPAGSYCPMNVTAPVKCPSGTYTDTLGASACLACDPGTYSYAGSTKCTDCPKGWFCEGGDDFGKCPGGTYTDQTKSTACSSCPAGTYNDQEGQPKCKACPAGKYNPEKGKTACTSCPADTYNDDSKTGVTECKKCDEGFYSLEGSTTKSACTSCGAGTYGSGGRCIDCQQGYYCPGGKNRQACPAGTYNPETGKTGIEACLPCEEGTWHTLTARTAATQCTACPAGKYCEKGQEPQLCPEGSYCPAGSKAPTKCEPGTYQDKTGQSSCKKCPIGSYCAGGSEKESCPVGSYCPAGSKAPTKCEPGTYQDKTGQSSCKKCAAGTYNPNSGSTGIEACEACPADTYNNAQGAAACISCDEGFYSPEGSTTKSACTSCEAGTYGSGGRCIDCQQGYYCPGGKNRQACSAGTYNPETGKTGIEACLPCEEGTYAPSTHSTECKECQEGYYCPSESQKQTPCPAGTYQNEQGKGSCKGCPTGSYCPGSGMGPQACPRGTYNPDTGKSLPEECRPCEDGKISSKSGQSKCDSCKKGYYPNCEHTSCVKEKPDCSGNRNFWWLW